MALTLNTNLMASNAARNLNSSYSRMATSVRRLSSGLRVGTAADDAAGLAIRELMRADIATLNQGVRNANDAISLIQTADGALGVIDEKLIRMKELAEQAATGTYNSDQRLMIDSEFQAMAAEIERIARATDFNGVKLLDGSRTGKHDGSGLESTGELKVHFGTGNDSAEDYYYLNIGDATLQGLGLAGGSLSPGEAGPDDSISKTLPNGVNIIGSSGLVFLGIIPTGTTNLRIHLDDGGIDDALQLFTKSGHHVVGTQITGGTAWFDAGIMTGSDIASVLTEANGFDAGATYTPNPTGLDRIFTPGTAGNTVSYNGMTIGYSGHGTQGVQNNVNDEEWLTIDVVTEDLILLLPGGGEYLINASWDSMPGETSGAGAGAGGAVQAISIKTQDSAQKALERIDDAIIRKDNIRAHLGAMQNRLENTVSNLQIQAENLQAAESRISDVDVATEMTEFVRNQILTQAAVAMLAQANSMPNVILSLLK